MGDNYDKQRWEDMTWTVIQVIWGKFGRFCSGQPSVKLSRKVNRVLIQLATFLISWECCASLKYADYLQHCRWGCVNALFRLPFHNTPAKHCKIQAFAIHRNCFHLFTSHHRSIILAMEEYFQDTFQAFSCFCCSSVCVCEREKHKFLSCQRKCAFSFFYNSEVPEWSQLQHFARKTVLQAAFALKALCYVKIGSHWRPTEEMLS